MDSVDARAAEEWLSNVARVLEGRSPDYLVVHTWSRIIPAASCGWHKSTRR